MARTPVSVKIEGLNALIRQLEAAGGDVEDLKDAFAKIAAQGARLASSFAPRKTGRLAASVRGNRAKNKAVISAGRAAVPYAPVQNYGSPKQNIPATSFMQRADQALQPRAIKELDKALRDAIKARGLD